MTKKFNLIFLEDKLLLSSKQYTSWAEIQNEYESYKASVDFDSLDDVKQYIISDYKLDKDFVDTLINKFIEGKKNSIQLEFKRQ